jgi:4-hydroxy-tetrahydrodipicolinate reductase
VRDETMGDEEKQEPKFLIAGYGTIGQLVHKVLMARGADVVAIAEPDKEKVPADLREKLWIPGVERLEDGESEGTAPDNPGIVYDADTAICFTDPAAGYETTKFLLGRGIDTVVGTTAWYLNPDKTVNEDMITEIRDLAIANKCRFVYAPNFSVGVSVLRMGAIYFANHLMRHGYDVAVEERHHNRKKDPSGTGVAICNDLMAARPEKTAIKLEGHDTKRQPHELTLSVTRAGNIPGTHTVVFGGQFDTIEIRHTVNDRAVFAEGAVNAAYLAKGTEPGAYVLEHLLG